MKKLCALIAAVLMLTTSLIPAFSAEPEKKEEDSNSIVIKFAVGDSVLNINGKDVTVVQPYVVEGVTLVPVRVITEAFGANLNWDSETKTVTVLYKDVTIKLAIDNKIATINGNNTELLAPPEIRDGSTMLPLRFITESFGADVTFDSEASKITVDKEVTLANSIKDYASILKRSTKDKIGDSYYNWSIKRTSEFKLSERSFDGYHNYFESNSRDAEIAIQLDKPTEEVTIDTELEDLRDIAKENTTIDIGKKKSNSGLTYAHLQTKASDGYSDFRVYIRDGIVFHVFMFVGIDEGLKVFDEVSLILDTFDLDFQKDKAEDLSDLDGNQMRLFFSQEMNVKMLIPGDMLEDDSKDVSNEFSFYRLNKDSVNEANVHICVYSNLDNSNYKNWAETDLINNKKQANPKMATFTELVETVVDNKNAYLYSQINKNAGFDQSRKDIFIENGSYFVNISIELPINDKTEALMADMIKSISLGDIDKENVGRLIRPDNTEETKYKNYKNDKIGYSFDAPINWDFDQDAEMASIFDETNVRGLMVNTVPDSQFKGESISEIANIFYDSFDKQENTEMLTKSAVSETAFNKSAYKIQFKSKDVKTKANFIVTLYMLFQNEKLYQFTFTTIEYGDGEETNEIFSKIRNTFKFK